jgi:hypothetical protein
MAEIPARRILRLVSEYQAPMRTAADEELIETWTEAKIVAAQHRLGALISHYGGSVGQGLRRAHTGPNVTSRARLRARRPGAAAEYLEREQG